MLFSLGFVKFARPIVSRSPVFGFFFLNISKADQWHSGILTPGFPYRGFISPGALDLRSGGEVGYVLSNPGDIVIFDEAVLGMARPFLTALRLFSHISERQKPDVSFPVWSISNYEKGYLHPFSPQGLRVSKLCIRHKTYSTAPRRG